MTDRTKVPHLRRNILDLLLPGRTVAAATALPTRSRRRSGLPGDPNGGHGLDFRGQGLLSNVALTSKLVKTSP